MRYLIATLLLVGLVVAQEVPYSDVAPELGPVELTEAPAPDDPLSAADIGQMERDLEAAKHRYLIEHGWVQNPDNPAGLWLWSKHVRYADYRLDTDTALNTEFALEPPTDEMLVPYSEPVAPE